MQSLLLGRLERYDLQKFIWGAENSLRAVEHMDTYYIEVLKDFVKKLGKKGHNCGVMDDCCIKIMHDPIYQAVSDQQKHYLNLAEREFILLQLKRLS
ncbi:hypothetical protein TNCV_4095621 [Trichonephila clavipes]|uniref:Uncharacterized protein n=1 Tax=Trichonephila clavipes TaxID=2585209 RepID=A0A8X6SED5_TRICX|nr:hypothetical protein TNCV_4095621 [Trichonephila clavipes]